MEAAATSISSRLTSLAHIARMPQSKDRVLQEKEAGVQHRDLRIEQLIIHEQDRTDFIDVMDFAARLKIAGSVHTPILVRDLGNGEYELVAGERRTRASQINGWETIPAKIFPKDTPDFILRLYQVSENVDRKSLTVREVATGLAKDVATYGREKAAMLWTSPGGKQRSESWISKHLRFQKFGPVTRALFDEGRFDDIEAANKLHDLELISPDIAEEYAAQMRNGTKVSRLTLDLRLTELRTPPPVPGKPRVQSAPLEAQTTDAIPPIHGFPPVPPRNNPADSAAETSGMQANAGNETGAETGGEMSSKPANTMASLPATRVRDGRKPEGASRQRIQTHMRELYETSTGTIPRARQLRADFTQANADETDVDWHLWVAFADVACSMLIGVGQERADALLKRLNLELESQTPVQLLNSLHPTLRAGVAPDDFRYDTGREMHPQPPVQWAL
ncbi:MULTISPECIES: ParB/RepB/Spo0J family partition protein [Paraburkholderia]|uniref:ParB N-terminal domain-containing protein n=1 Tax=Paraburkholderia madseniana TaxID=2599607 RepID=A0AAP5BL87_9BURK|nr:MULTISPECIES: ParB N-terminal domain-containing protein [Paraburkholderia]MCX4150026.1 ParB N-terminal domain-containing protein [Paraburkholderia madseniana]MCX4175683.1 ParB N-terminal domain-containing protein [Paraburkholderia madseniana]MDN7152962.1 ParB N-terminal domain-containing protein [Paraburkholderia sp. WS6]MDQ6411844.1 ParB N-terminal domain-containing protein [Paraburkholderia madseniana]MDQ6463678.1 ParB N-terminal domain-containing protein [Paraburkholderia madseniana]